MTIALEAATNPRGRLPGRQRSAAPTRPGHGLHIRLYPAQYDFVFDRARYPAFIGGRNSGKTHSGSIKALLKAYETGGLGVIAAPTFPQLEDGAKKQTIARLDEAGIPYTLIPSRNRLYIPSFDAEIMFATLENASRVRSPNFSWGWVDELEYLTDIEIWRALKGAVRVGDFQLFATSTPKGRRLVYVEWVIERDPNHTLHRAQTWDNPFVDASTYISSLGYAGRYYEQEILADFVSFQGLVYPGFKREERAKAIDTAGWRRVLGVDVGHRNPTAILELAAAGDRRHIASETYQSGLGSRGIVLAIEERADATGAETIVIDPSAAATIADLEADGYDVTPANNNVKDGVAAVATAIADGLTVDPNCVNTLAEFESYQYPDKRPEADKPLKQGDHAMDALRYATMALAEPETTTGPLPKETQEWMEAWTDGL